MLPEYSIKTRRYQRSDLLFFTGQFSYRMKQASLLLTGLLEICERSDYFRKAISRLAILSGN